MLCIVTGRNFTAAIWFERDKAGAWTVRDMAPILRKILGRRRTPREIADRLHEAGCNWESMPWESTDRK